jgi:hypothetical protein
LEEQRKVLTQTLRTLQDLLVGTVEVEAACYTITFLGSEDCE